MGLQQIVYGPVVTVILLNAAVERELVKRAHVELERRKPGPVAVVYALGICPVGFATRLPVPFEE